MFVDVVVYGIGLPATVSLVVLLVGWRPWGRSSHADGWALASGAVAGAAGLILAQVLLLGGPMFPPVQANDWFVLLLAAAGVLGVADALFAQPPVLRWLLRGLMSAALPILLLLPLARHTWSPGEAVAILSALALGIMLLWTSLDRLTRLVEGPVMPLILALVAGGSGAALALSGSASMGQLAGALAATLGPAFLLALWRPGFSLARGAVPPLTVGLGGLWFSGAFYADLPLASLILLLVAPAAALAGGLRALRGLPAWKLALVRSASVGLVLAVAAGLAWSVSPPLSPDVYW